MSEQEKKRIRTSHRGSVIRITSQAQEMLEGEINVVKLTQYLTSLKDKLGIILTLDSEILDVTEGQDDITNETEQADITRELIETTMMEIQEALSDLSSPRGQAAQNIPANGHTDTRPRESTTSSSTEVPSSGNQSQQQQRTVETTRDSSDTTPGNAEPAAHVNPGSTSNKVRLPKLELRRFDGELTEWTAFWDSYESAIHNSIDLSAIDKFTYLRSLLEGPAATAIAGLTLSSPNYAEAITILKKRFGNKQAIVSRHMDTLMNLEAVASQNNYQGLRQLYNLMESHVRGLHALGIPSSSFGTLLASVFMNKLPPELRLTVSREVVGDN